MFIEAFSFFNAFQAHEVNIWHIFKSVFSDYLEVFSLEVEGMYRSGKEGLIGGPKSRINGRWRHRPLLDATRPTLVFLLVPLKQVHRGAINSHTHFVPGGGWGEIAVTSLWLVLWPALLFLIEFCNIWLCYFSGGQRTSFVVYFEGGTG